VRRSLSRPSRRPVRMTNSSWIRFIASTVRQGALRHDTAAGRQPSR
jgi:hypothetical protein